MRNRFTARQAARVARLARRLIRDESGAEILEYVLIAGLIIVATIALIGAVGTKVMARWTSVSNASL
jgi:Flp pilus assembly pilin Flp